jgi:hypothetical protein
MTFQNEPRILSLTDEEYFSGQWDERPALSQSIAKIIHTKSARHAWRAHRRLGGSPSPMSDPMRLGKLADAATFDDLKGWEILEADSWRGGLSKRLASARNGERVCLAHEAEAARGTALRIRTALNDFGIPTGVDQVVGAWTVERRIGDQNREVLCSCKFDAIDVPGRIVWDLKRTADANPKKLDRHIANIGWHIQAAAYTEGAAWLYGGEIVADDGEDVVPREIAGEYMAAGRAAWEGARHVWATCLAACMQDDLISQWHGYWPGYADSIMPAECPKWLTLRNDDDVEGGYDLTAMTGATE